MSFEDELAETMKKMEPDASLKAKVTALYRAETPRRHRVPAPLKYAACFALVLAVLAGGAVFQPLQPVRKEGPQAGAFSVPATGFAVVVNAATADGGRQEELKPGHAFRLTTDGPINGMETTGGRHEANSKKIDWEAFFGFQLKCVGTGIEKVTYETNRGEFQNLVKMNAIQKLYYDTHRTMNGSLWEKTLRPAGGNLAYQPVGTAQTLTPDSDGVLYLRLTMSTDVIDTGTLDSQMKFTTKYENQILEGAEIKITVFFQDGTRSRKAVRLSYPEGERTADDKVAVEMINP